MENPVQQVTIGNIPKALGLEQYRDNNLYVTEQTQVMDQCDTIDKIIRKSLSPATAETKTEGVCVKTQAHCDTEEVSLMRPKNEVTTEIVIDEVADKPPDKPLQCDAQERIESDDDMGGASNPAKGQGHATASSNKCAAVQARAMKEKESKPPKPLKVTTIDGLEIGPEQLIQQQKSDNTLKRHWELADKPAQEGKSQFITKKGILYRKYNSKTNVEHKLQLVVPVGLRERVVALTHDTLLSGHRGASKTLE